VLGVVALTALILLRVLMGTSIRWASSWRRAELIGSPVRRAA
jgi:hypothetical protein